jgi:type IV pilus assembly protein PilA
MFAQGHPRGLIALSTFRHVKARLSERVRTPSVPQEQGFTLIELMVVVLIIAILIAIAIPTFLGARSRAQDRAAQSDLRNGLTAEKTVYTDNQTYSNDTSTAGMKGIEGSLNWGGVITTKAALSVTVGDAVTVGDKGIVCLSEPSKSGTVFSIADVANGTKAGTYFGKAACPALTGTPAANSTAASGIGSSW